MPLFGKKKKAAQPAAQPTVDPEENLRQQIGAEGKRGAQLREALSPLADPGAVDELVVRLRRERMRGQLLRFQLENIQLARQVREEQERLANANRALEQQLQQAQSPPAAAGGTPPAPTP